MGEVINLRQFRKARERAEADATAQTNRAKFGRTKGEKARDADEAARRTRLLDQARREIPRDSGAAPGDTSLPGTSPPGTTPSDTTG